MNLHHFRRLKIEEQLNLLYREGTYIGKRTKKSQKVILFQFQRFYVEIIYGSYRRYIKEVKGFTSTRYLTPYLKQIDVEELFTSEPPIS